MRAGGRHIISRATADVMRRAAAIFQKVGEIGCFLVVLYCDKKVTTQIY
jgi:hypothetical protein